MGRGAFYSVVLAGLIVAGGASAQTDLLRGSWRILETPHFTFFSQLSESETLRRGRELEQWRGFATVFLTGRSPPAPVPVHVYLFGDSGAFGQFAPSADPAFFTPNPRANYLVLDTSASRADFAARHFYAHFLIRNFADLSLPRWYEEGLATYLARLEFRDGGVIVPGYPREQLELWLRLDREIPLDELLYDEDALASTRMIQVANLKSEGLLYFLLHGHLAPGFADYREALQTYLRWLLEGRRHRFAFDQSFDPSTSQLDDEYRRFLAEAHTEAVELQAPGEESASQWPVRAAAADELAVALGELSLYSGDFEQARRYFAAGEQAGGTAARLRSGHADALRMLESGTAPEELHTRYREAVELEPENPDILLDYAVYLETLVSSCEAPPASEEREALHNRLYELSRHALDLAPNDPEANLAMAQWHLLRDDEWRAGREYQSTAFRL